MRATTAALLVALGAAASAASAQQTSALAGVVRDLNGHPIPFATLSVDGQALRAQSNDSGHFFLGGIPSGRTGFTLAKIGFSAVRFEIDLQPDTTLVVSIPMRPVQNLPEVSVAGERISAKLLQVGFYDRQRQGIGQFIDNDRIERIAGGALNPSTFLRDVRGLQVRCRAAGPCRVIPTSQSCVVTVVNKVMFRGELDDAVATNDVYAIEVYERGVLVPIDFSLPRSSSTCGVIVVWTKTFVDMKR